MLSNKRAVFSIDSEFMKMRSRNSLTKVQIVERGQLHLCMRFAILATICIFFVMSQITHIPSEQLLLFNFLSQIVLHLQDKSLRIMNCKCYIIYAGGNLIPLIAFFISTFVLNSPNYAL